MRSSKLNGLPPNLKTVKRRQANKPLNTPETAEKHKILPRWEIGEIILGVNKAEPRLAGKRDEPNVQSINYNSRGRPRRVTGDEGRQATLVINEMVC